MEQFQQIPQVSMTTDIQAQVQQPIMMQGMPLQFLPGQIPLQQGQIPIQKGQIPLQQGQIQIQQGQIPVQQGQIPVQQGQLPIQGQPQVIFS